MGLMDFAREINCVSSISTGTQCANDISRRIGMFCNISLIFPIIMLQNIPKFLKFQSVWLLLNLDIVSGPPFNVIVLGNLFII